MKAKLAIQEFIEQHSDWEKLLSEKPYCLEIKRDNVFGKNLILFKYNQIETSWADGGNIVRECRGLVLDEDTLEPVVVPFYKFFNDGEFYADKVDWNTAKVTQKLDGSLCKIVKISENDILIGTNGTIDAFKAPLAEQLGCKAKNFGDLVLEGLAYYGLNQEMLATILDYDKTYMFELCSPYNQVVVRWPETKLFFIGARDNKTFQEEKFEDCHLADVFDTPKIYDMHSSEDCIKAANELPDSEEGYVVRDADFKRVKIKSPKYLALHRLSGNGIMTYEHAIELVRLNETEEVITYFPNFKTTLDEVKTKYDKLVADLEVSHLALKECLRRGFLPTRKDQAMWIQKNFRIAGTGFALLDEKVKSVKEWIMSCPVKSLVKSLGLKDCDLKIAN